MGVDFKNVPFGYLRPELARRSVGRSASRRRGNVSERGNLTLEQQATADASENKNSFPAIVLRSRYTTHKRGTDRVAMLSPETAEGQYKNYIYNVYYHGNAAFPAPDSLEDPRIPTYPEATLDSSALSSVSGLGNSNNNYDLTSRLVMIEFEDPERRLNARIKSVGKYTDLPIFESKLSQTFVGGALGGGGGTSAPGAGTTSKGEVPTGGGIFHKGKDNTQHIAFGASYVHGNQGFAKQMGMDRLAWSGQQIDYIKDQIAPAIDEGKLNLAKYTHAFFFTGPNSLSKHQKGATVFALLEDLIAEVKTHNSGIKIVVVTIQGFSRWGLRTCKKKGGGTKTPCWGLKTIAKIAKATKDYNALIEESKKINTVIKWAELGTINYGITPDLANPKRDNLEKFSIKYGKATTAGGVNYEQDKLHPNKAGHREIMKMIKKISGIS